MKTSELDRAEHLIMGGRLDEALPLMEKAAPLDRPAVLALSCLLQGKQAEALALYEEGLKKIRRVTGKRKVGYGIWTAVFYPLLLLNTGASEKKIKDYIDGAVEVCGASYPITLTLIRYLYDPQASQGEFFALAPTLTGNPNLCVAAFFYFLYAYWLDKKRARDLLPFIQTTYRQLVSLKLFFFVPELALIIREIAPESAAPVPNPPSHPLKDLLTGQETWQRFLAALSGIGVKHVAQTARGGKRFAWEIAWTSGRKPLGWIALSPMEQTLQRAGWTGGKGVALKRLYRKADAIASMTDQDHRAASAVREHCAYYGAEYSIDVPQALEALAGHPYIFRPDGGRVAVTTDEPDLTALCDGDFYLLKLEPFPENDAAHSVREDGPNALRVTCFREHHLKMAQILGPKGLVVPASAKDSLLKTLGVLASVVTVHSDIEGIEAASELIQADRRLYVQLQPSGEGLDVEVVLRPLGPDGISCRPGAGGGTLFGLRDGKRVQARRELDKEKDAFMDMVRSCPALTEGEQLAEGRWRLLEPEQALEFLTQLGERKDTVALEWPKGQPLRVRSQVAMSSLNVAVRNSQDWFALSGELRVDEDLVLNIKDILQLMQVGHGRFLPLGEGQFLALTREFQRRLQLMASLGERRGEEIRVSPLAVGSLASLLDDAGSLNATAEWDRQHARILEAGRLDPDLPKTFRAELRSYQQEGFRWLTRLAHWGAGACLADDMGLGKTIQTLALLVARGRGGPALIVAPTSVCSNWMDEASRFAPTLNFKELRYADREETLASLGSLDIVVTSYGLLQNESERLASVRWHTLVLDEAQAIKNMDTKRSAAAMKLQSDFRMVTTGTPVENRLSELWNLFRFLNPHYLGSLESFNRRFATPIERDGDKEARSRLKRAIQPFILRRTKEQVLTELPPKTEITLRVAMREEERALYETLRRRAVEELSGQEGAEARFRVFAELMKLRRACCNAALIVPEGRFPSAKMEAFTQILQELRENGHKALVFSQFVDHLSLIRKSLDEEGVPYQYLDGATPPPERARRVKAFQAGEGDCFLISLKAGGTGLNLTAADYVVHMDPWWNPAVEEQASDRAHRIGQERPVTVYRIVAQGTIEEKIVDLHAWKRDLAESLLDDGEAALRLSPEEMLALIQLP